jgi:DNA-binding NarL/FixJ family response regulator
MPPKKHRVFLVDDHPIVCQGLALLINHEPDLTVCGTATNARAALDAILKNKPDVVVTDLSMPGADGLELIKNLRAQLPHLQILVLSMHDEMLYAERALKAGARGYIMKHAVETNIMTAIRRIVLGEIYLSPAMTGRLLSKLSDQPDPTISPLAKLGDRELHVFELLGRGLRTTAIATELGIGIKTVETHIGRIRVKLNLSNSHEVARQAVLWLQPPPANP